LRFRNVLSCVSSGSRVQHAARAARGSLAYTERLRSSLMGLISILRRPMVATVKGSGVAGHQTWSRYEPARGWDVAGGSRVSRNKRSWY
jgi:hypothetical protein